MDVATPLLKLPPELTERIAGFLRIESPGADCDEHLPVEPDTETGLNASKTSMYDFCAFRLTCKDVYLKTHRLFGRRYFATVSVGFASASLNRLRDMAKYRNILGLTVSEFPVTLLVSTYRLPSGNEAGQLLSVSKDLDPSADAHAIVACISLACQLGLENHRIHGPYSHHIYAVAEHYKRAALDQQWVTILDRDVDTLALAMAAFPKFDTVTLDSTRPGWGQQNWHLLAGIERESFTDCGDLDSGQSNANFAMGRTVQAIAQAQTICRAEGRDLDLFMFDASSRPPIWNGRTDSRQHIGLQTLGISSSIRRSLQPIFSLLGYLSIDLNDFVPGKNLKRDTKKIKRALDLLLSSSILGQLVINLMDPGEDFDEGMHNENRPDHVWIGDQMLSMIVETEKSKGLECLELSCNAIVESMHALEKLIKKHAATLERITITTQVLGAVDLDVYEARTQCQGLIRAIAGCPLLCDIRLSFGLDTTLTNVVHLSLDGKDAVAARLQAMMASPIEPEYDDIWDDDSKDDNSSESDSTEG
jgi:hypothetical protein